MNIIYRFFTIALLGCACIQSAFAQTTTPYTPQWGKAANFGVLCGSTINNTGSTRLTGDAGSINQPRGFDNITLINGTLYTGNAAQVNDPLNDVNNFFDKLGKDNYYSSATDLSGSTLGTNATDLVPGIYTFTGDTQISGTLRLNDRGNKLALYIFRIGGDLIVDAAVKVLMKSGGAAPNVFWIVSGQPMLGENASLAGNILTDYQEKDLSGNFKPAIVMSSGASVSGKLVTIYSDINLNTNSINAFVDADNDGVSDTYDDYPTDATRAYNNITSPSTIAFEDLWPGKGDYDMNDLVMKYSYNLVTNSSNYIVQVISADTLLATGGIRKNAFGIEFPIPAGLIQSINSGTQETGQANATFMLFSNMRDEMKTWNTIQGQEVSAPTIYNVDFRIDGGNEISMSQFTIDQINPFIVNYEKGSRREVHLPYKKPTSLADQSVLGTGDDASNLNSGYTYMTANGLPWAIILPTANFSYPAETKDISAAYPHFRDWATSGGTTNILWYDIGVAGNVNNSLIYYNAPF